LTASGLRSARNGRPQNPRPIVRALFIGGDFPRKGGLELLKAWRSSNLGNRAALDIVTDWPLEPGDLPLGVSPYTASWRELWRQADFFVMPTKHEAFGMVYQEAAAAGLPVVATNLNAIPEIVEDRVTGILVDPGNLPALVSAMRTLVESAELRHRMGLAADRGPVVRGACHCVRQRRDSRRPC
jgi:glycosyltransferase involved in cell wall biosynthesis